MNFLTTNINFFFRPQFFVIFIMKIKTILYEHSIRRPAIVVILIITDEKDLRPGKETNKVSKSCRKNHCFVCIPHPHQECLNLWYHHGSSKYCQFITSLRKTLSWSVLFNKIKRKITDLSNYDNTRILHVAETKERLPTSLNIKHLKRCLDYWRNIIAIQLVIDFLVYISDRI